MPYMQRSTTQPPTTMYPSMGQPMQPPTTIYPSMGQPMQPPTMSAFPMQTTDPAIALAKSEKELKQRSNEITLYAWSIIKMLIKIYDDDPGLTAPGDDPSKGIEDNKLNHFRLTLVSLGGQMKRYREDRSDLNLRNMMLTNLIQPTMTLVKEMGTRHIPDEGLCSGQQVSEHIMEMMGISIYTAPYTFQILRNWFMPAVVTYDNMRPDIVSNLVNDMLIETWVHILEGDGQPQYWTLFENIIEYKDKIKNTTIDEVIQLSMGGDDFVELCVIINNIKAIISSAAISMILKIATIFEWSPYRPSIDKQVKYLSSIKLQQGM